MEKLIVREFDPCVLDHATLIESDRLSRFFDVYDLNDGNIMKVARSSDDVYHDLDGCSNRKNIMIWYEMIMDELFDKLKRSEDKNLPNHTLPKEIQMTNGVVKDYIISKVPPEKYVRLIEYLSAIKLSEFARIMIKYSKKVEKANKQGVYMPDLGNPTNTFFNPKTNDFKFIDYDGMQIDEFKTNCASNLIRPCDIPIEGIESFFDSDTGLFKPNIDILSLFSIFLYYTTKTRLMNFKPTDYYVMNGKFHLMESSLREYTKLIGLNGTQFEGALFELFFGENPDYPHKYIKQLLKESRLSPYGNIRRFEKI